MRLAVSRTASAMGRIRRLIVSIITSAGMSNPGAPSGTRWAIAMLG